MRCGRRSISRVEGAEVLGHRVARYTVDVSRPGSAGVRSGSTRAVSLDRASELPGGGWRACRRRVGDARDRHRCARRRRILPPDAPARADRGTRARRGYNPPRMTEPVTPVPPVAPKPRSGEGGPVASKPRSGEGGPKPTAHWVTVADAAAVAAALLVAFVLA